MSIKCCVCPTDADEFSDINDLEAHIAAEHFDCVPFECEKCRFSKFPTEFAIKRHFEQDHCIKEYYIRYKISNGLTEKLCSVRDCLQRSCEAAGVDFPYTVFPAPLNNVDEAMARRAFRRAPPVALSNGSSSAMAVDGNGGSCGGNGSDSGVIIKCESGYSPASNSLDGDAPPVAVAVADGDVANDALTAFLQSASHALNNNNNNNNNADGDTNNNYNDDDGGEEPKVRPDDLNAFCSKLLSSSAIAAALQQQQQRWRASHDSTSARSGAHAGYTMDENQQAQQLLRNLECQLSNHNNSNLIIRRKRQMDKRMSIMARNAKRRFGQDAHNTSAGGAFAGSQRDGGLGGGYASGGGSAGANRNGFTNFFPSSFNGSSGRNMGGSGSPAVLTRHTPTVRQPSKVNEVQCQECKEMVTNRATSLNYHVNMKHLKFALFVCKGCNRQFLWQKTTIVTHVQRYHNGDESLIEDNSSLYMSQINLSRKIFFPVKCPASATATITSATPLAHTSAIGGGGGLGDLSGADFGDLTGGSGLLDDDGGGGQTHGLAPAPTSVVITPSDHHHHHNGNNNNQEDTSDNDEDDEEADDDEDGEDEDDVGSNGGEQSTVGGPALADAFGAFHFGHHHNSNSSSSAFPTQASAPASAPPTSGRPNGHYFNDFNEPLTADFHNANSTGFDAAGMMSMMMDNGGGADERKSRQLQCQECNEMVVATKPWILLNHANSQHMNFPLFECGACHQVFTKYLRSYTVTHMKRYHDGREDLIIDNRPIYHARLQAKCLELFGVSI